MRTALPTVVITLLLLGPAILANDAKPSRETDSPIETYSRFLRAVKAGDIKAARQCFTASGKYAEKTVEIATDVLVLPRVFQRSMVAKFGEEGKTLRATIGERNFAEEDKAIDAALALLPKVRVAIDGDTATIHIPHDESVELLPFGPGEIDLRRTKGAWKILATEPGMSADEDPTDPSVTRMGAAMAASNRVMRSIMDDVSAGRIKTVAEANATLRKRLQTARDELARKESAGGKKRKSEEGRQ